MGHFPSHIVRDLPQDLPRCAIHRDQHGFSAGGQDGFAIINQWTLSRIPERDLCPVFLLYVESPQEIPVLPVQAHNMGTRTDGQDV